MEKKTIGAFIAALRKANGMTQKQLADLLMVSDKAVSRWERDESLPDLTLIPVIAEVFGVTCDELLKGQKNNPLAPPAESTPPKQTKQLQHLLKQTASKYRIRSIISLGIALLGLVGAMICNFAFQRGQLGFLVGIIFYGAAAICQAIFTIQSYTAMDDDSFDTAELDNCRLELFHCAKQTFSSILLLTVFSIPFLFAYDAYFGITFDTWLTSGIAFLLIGAALCFLIIQIITIVLARRNVLPIPSLTVKLAGLKLRSVGFLALSFTVLILIQAFLNNLGLQELFVSGTTFDTWDSYKTYMETPLGDQNTAYADAYTFSESIMDVVPIPSVPADGEPYYFDEYGNPLSEDEFFSETVTAPDGTVLCSFRRRNFEVYRTEYSFDSNEDGLPVTVYTRSDRVNANRIMNYINQAYCLLYCTALMAAVVYYRNNRKKFVGKNT